MKKGILFFLFIPFIIFIFFITGPLGNNLSKKADYSLEEIPSSLSNLDLNISSNLPIVKNNQKIITTKPIIKKVFLNKDISTLSSKQIKEHNKLRSKRLKAIKKLSKRKNNLYCLNTFNKKGINFYAEEPFFEVNDFMDSLTKLNKEYYVIDKDKNKYNILNCYDIADNKYRKYLIKKGGYIPSN